MLDSLRSEIGAQETPRSLRHGLAPLQFGDRQLDEALPWGGLPRATLHEISGTTAAAGFAAALAGRLAEGGSILWCRRAWREMGDWYGPGLIPFGLDPEQIVFVETRKKQDLLWAMEEGLRSGQPALVVGETEDVGLVASRRLQLAAEAGGVTAFLLNAAVTRQIASNAAEAAASSVALTRWNVSSEARTGNVRQNTHDLPRWRVDLAHCRGGLRRSWLVEWNHEWPEQPAHRSKKEPQGRFSVVAEFSDRQGDPQPALRRVS